MAGGYLGKISAVISANTGDYVRKLNDSAQQTRAFAKTVESTLRTASSGASKALEGIYTPLQKVERALRAAASEKLAFRGFDGAIRDVQTLQKAVAKLTDQRTIDLVVKTSGVGSLDELKRTINTLRNQDVAIGVEGLRSQRASLGRTDNYVVTMDVRQEGARLDSVIEALERIDAEKIKRISLQVESQQLDAATLQLRRLTELASQAGTPLSRIQAEFSGLGQAVQAQFAPALANSQRAVEQFRARVEQSADVSSAEFRGLVDDVRLLEAAFGRLRETSSLTGRLLTGQELTFVRPGAADELNRLAAAQQQLAAAPASVRGSPIARELLADGQVLREQIDRISARIERLNAQGLDIRLSQAGLDLAVQRLEEVRRLTEEVAAGPAQSGSAEAAALIRRAAAEREFYAESQRLREQAAADARALAESEAAPLIRRAAAEREFYAESQRLREQAAADARAIANDPNDPSNTGRATQLSPGYLRDGLASRASAELGPDIASTDRAFSGLRGSIVSLKGQLDSLPAGVRAQFIPAIQGAEAEYRRLYSTAGATTQEIEEAAARLAAVERGVTQAANANRQFGGTFAQFRDTADARTAAAGLEFLRTSLSRATGDATVAAAAVDRLSQAYERAASTPGGFQRDAADLQRLANEAIEATAAVDGVGRSQASLQRGFARVGDVARGAFGNVGLGIQQAAFAFEDFFSVTGGLDQRIRAAGNNISQLGFILGSTEGLIAGVSVAIASQLVVALINWYNAGRTTEDQTKSLNDALARQKSLVEELKQAFDSLGDSIANRVFSAGAREAKKFSDELGEVAKKQREQRVERQAVLDPNVQQERATQAARQRELEASADPEERVRLQRELERSRQRERAMLDGIANAQQNMTQGDRDRAVGGLQRAFTGVNADRLGQGRNDLPDDVALQIAGRQAEELLATIQGTGAREQIASLREQQRVIDRDMRSGGLSRGAGSRAVADIEAVIESISAALDVAADALAIEITKSANSAAVAIESAQNDVADAIRRGVRGAADFQAALDNTARQLDQAMGQLKDAQEIKDPVAKEAAVKQAESRVNDIRLRQDAINEAAREVRLGRTFGGERTTSALSSLRGDDRFSNEFAGLRARLAAAVDAELAASAALAQAKKSGSEAAQAQARAELEAAQSAGEMAAAAAEAALAMEEAVSRLRKVIDGALSQSEQIADNAQSRLTERPTDANRRRRDAAEQQLIADRERVARANNALNRRRSEVQQSDPELVAINAELESITQERKRLESEASINNTTLDPAEAQRLADREAELLAKRERRMYELTEAERKQADAVNEEIAARRRMIDFMEEVERRRNVQGDPTRGLDLMETPREGANRDVRQSLADIRAAAAASTAMAIREGRGADIPGIAKSAEEARRRAVEDAMQQAAPAIMGFREERLNAALQGPSRAALNVADTNTMEGQRELNRLLRGDDPAKDVNLVELQKQSELLQGIIDAVKEDGGAVVEIRG